MTQTVDLPAALRRLQAEAQRNTVPLVSDEDEAAWERYRAFAATTLAALVLALIEARITVREFERAMTEQIRQSHLIAYAIARGGLNALTDDDRLRVNERVNGQIGYLQAWVAGLTLTAGGLLLAGKATSLAAQRARANLYLEATRASLFDGAGAAIGLPRLPAQPGDGSTRCRTRCRCRWMIEQVGESDWNAYWLLGIAEHCEHCPRRAIAWSPLRIRNGVIERYVRTGLFL